MINRIVNFLSSMRFATLLLLVFAFSIGYATFVENDFGSSSSKSLIYNTWWFEFILISLATTLVLNVFKFNLFRKEKLATLIYHLSFIIILLGAGITRYTGYEGMMRIKEGEKSNTFLSDDTYLQVRVNDGNQQFKYDKKLHLSGITKQFDDIAVLKHLFSNYFSISNSDLKQGFTITYTDFLANAADSSVKSEISGIRLSSSGDSDRKGTQLSVNDFINKEIKIGEFEEFKGINFTVNNQKESSVNFFIKDNSVKCFSDFDISIISMPPNGEPPIIYEKGTEFDLNKMSLLTINDKRYMFSDFSFNEDQVIYSTSNNMDNTGKNETRSNDALILDVKVGEKSKNITLKGRKGMYPNSTEFSIDELNFELTYGPKFFTTPFFIHLNDFQLEKYPGSNSPSSFASEVEVIDGDTRFPYRIFMNNVLDYKGHRFFQSSYDPDESGTILSVNHDWWGTLVSYIGYGLLMLGMITIFFFKNTRFKILTKNLKKIKSTSLLVFLVLSSISVSAQSDQTQEELLERYKVSSVHASNADDLLIQNDGRIKPLSTFSSELIRKITRKEKLYGQNSTQIYLGIISFPQLWDSIPLIRVQHKQLLKELNSEEELVSFYNFFNSENGHYIFQEKVRITNGKADKDKSKYDKELLKVTERLNILYSIINTKSYNSNLNVFPNQDSNNTKWVGNLDVPHPSGDSIIYSNLLNYYLGSIQSAIISENWSFSDTLLGVIKKYQRENGNNIIQSDYKIDLEILYNKVDIFTQLFMYYFFVGLLMLVLLIVQMFHDKRWIFYTIKILRYLVITGWIFHTLGLIARWIISNHAPWTNGYEAMIYTVWATMFAGIIFARKSNLTLATTTSVSSLLLLFAFVSYLDPTITNVVPVLNSYWLMIHVSIIVASYGFLILGGFLGLLSLMLMIFKNNRNKKVLDLKISELTIINEKTLTIGIYMLTIGTFLGGIWANESWGRYWGWDPKETWALVSILVYAFILHMRFVPALKGKYTFNVASVFAVYSVLMTYFGVNYLLSGLHSYAAGDTVEIPNAVWISVGIVVIISILAKLKNNTNK